MTADGDDGALQRLGCAHKIDLDCLPGVESLGEPGDAGDAVRPHHRHDDARAALHWRGDEFFPYAAQPDTKELFFTRGREDLAAHVSRDLEAGLRRHAEHALHERLHEQIARDGGGDRVAGYADHRLAVHDAERHGVAGPDGDSVDHKLPQLTDCP